jgi:hypothetical protein
MVQGALCGLELVARCQALATQSKFTAYGTYIKVTVQLKALVADFTANAANALVLRSARLAAEARAAGAPLRGCAPAPPLLHLSLSDILGKELSEGALFGEAEVQQQQPASGSGNASVGVMVPPPELLPLPSPVGPAPGSGCASAEAVPASTDGSDVSGLWA